ncbi:hypothetical protein QN277_010687 [Acacia crassicarpa]|uniref:Uncharacterized protein n=1 Tax=Acacia crassicarpa TaxID=499986 RepID=A0AAE1IN33_9FABA|nr:hypothetical protein QN277_010687 [Acacia crassicarpa]
MMCSFVLHKVSSNLAETPLRAPSDAQRLDSLVGPPTKRFLLHHSFPPFCTNEVGKRAGLNRHEVGHDIESAKASRRQLKEAICAALFDMNVPAICAVNQHWKSLGTLA